MHINQTNTESKNTCKCNKYKVLQVHHDLHMTSCNTTEKDKLLQYHPLRHLLHNHKILEFLNTSAGILSQDEWYHSLHLSHAAKSSSPLSERRHVQKTRTSSIRGILDLYRLGMEMVSSSWFPSTQWDAISICLDDSTDSMACGHGTSLLHMRLHTNHSQWPPFAAVHCALPE